MSQVHYQPLGPLLAGEGSRAFLGLALQEGAEPSPVVLVWAPPEVTRDSSLVAQLEQETRRACNFDHPNILRVHGLVSLDAGLARVTEYADGESLRRVLEACKRLPPPFASLIVTDVAMGLHYGHVAGNDDGTPLVHGDLRPETIMVSFNGLSKVSGYGALAVAPREAGGRRVRNRRYYSAPEQLMGGREASSVRTDVFLLGLLLYECLSGNMPFHEMEDPDQALLNEPLPPLPADVPAGFQEIIRCATAKRANERYENALEFREAVSSVISDLPAYEQFAEYLQQLFPPNTEARASRQRLLEAGYSSVRGAPGGWAASGLAAPAPAPRHNTFQVEIATETPSARNAPSARHNTFQLEVDIEEPPPSSRRPTGRRPSVEQPASAAAGASSRRSSSEEQAEEEQSLRPPRRSPKLFIAAGALVALAAGAYFFLSGRDEAPPTSPVQPVATSQGASGTTASQQATPEPPRPQPAPPQSADGGSPGSAQAAAAQSAGAGAAGAGQAGLETRDGGAVAADQAPNTGTPEPAQATELPATATLQLVVQPSVRVFLEGKDLGRTPISVKLPPGRHSLLLADVIKGVRKKYEVLLTDGRPNKLRVRLSKGMVVVRTPKGATIFVNGRKMGRAPLAKLPLYEGEHVLKVTKAGAQWEKTFLLQARKRLTFTAELQPAATP